MLRKIAESLFLVVLLFLASVSAGCAYKPAISREAKEELQKPVDCGRAEEDIKTLESEKAAISDEVKSGAKMFVPASAVRGILHGDYIDRERVATGQYNSDIDAKIKEIKITCGLE